MQGKSVVNCSRTNSARFVKSSYALPVASTQGKQVTINQNSHQYEIRMDRVINYIYDHLDEEIDLNRLAEIACLSPYHWHRIYRAIKGETIKATVKRLRLHRAATQLANTKMHIERIVKMSGYKSLPAFSRAFAKAYSMPPAQYREFGKPCDNLKNLLRGELKMQKVEIRDMEEIPLVGLRHKGPYMEIGRAFERLGVFGQKHGLIEPGMASFALYFDDPDLVPHDQLNSFAGMLETKPVDLDAPFERLSVEAGRFAVMRYKGPYSELPKAYNWFYGEWLQNEEVELRDAPCMEEYLNNPRSVAPADLLTDLFMPIK